MIKHALRLVLGVGSLLVSGVASAQVSQTDAAMTSLPQPVAMAEWNLVTMSWARNTMTES